MPEDSSKDPSSMFLGSDPAPVPDPASRRPGWAISVTEARKPGSEPAATAAPFSQLRPGLRFGPCETVRLLGRGGMGEVWLARNEAEGRDEAVKVLLTLYGDEHERRRFIREAKVAMKLDDCPDIIRTYDVGEQEGCPFIRMEYVEGISLDEHTPGTMGEVLPLFKRMAAALVPPHRRGIVHRDVKPANFIIREDGSLKLMDFGLALPMGASTLTVSQTTLGTPFFMSPEQWSDSRGVDARTDVYALGVSYYRLLSGRLPFDPSNVSSPHAYLVKITTEDPTPLPPPRGLPAELPNLIYKAMAKRAEERFEHAGDLLAALERIDRDPDFKVVPPLTEAARRRRTIIRRSAAAVALVLAVVAGLPLLRPGGERGIAAREALRGGPAAAARVIERPLGEARAAEGRGPRAREEAIGHYTAVLLELTELGGELRSDVEKLVGVTKAEVEEKLAALRAAGGGGPRPR